MHLLKSNGRHFCVSMCSSQTLSKLCLEISVYWLLRHFRQPCRISNVEIIAVYANGHNVICTSFQAAEIHSEAVHPGSCQFVRASRCRFALTWRADDLTAPPPPWPLPRPLLHISMDASLSLHLYIMAAAAQRVRARSTAHQPSDSARREKRGEMRRNHLHPLLIHRLYLTPQPQASLR